MRKIVTAFLLFLLASNYHAHAETILFQDAALLQAAELGDYDKMRSALVKGENPDTVNTARQTPFIVAAKGEYIDLLELLVEYKASVNWRDTLGNTALIYAVDKISYETTQFLLDNGANPNIQNDSGTTALMNAAYIGDLNIIHMLLESNPDLTIKDFTGRSLLDFARNSRNRDAEKILIKAGASD